MRRIGVPVFAAAVAISAGVAVAARAPVTTTMTVTPTAVTYGSSVTASGVVSSRQAGERVTIKARGCGQNAFKVATHVVSTAGGRWMVVLRPTTNTQYHAETQHATSSIVAVAIRPKLRLAKTGRWPHRYSVRVSAAHNLGSRIVSVQRFRAARWVRLMRVTLGLAPGARGSGTFVSSTTFRSRIRAGQRVRVVLRAQGQDLAPCYVSGVSNTVDS